LITAPTAAAIAGVYRYIGAGTLAAPPMRTGPAMLSEPVTGVLASRERTALLPGSTVERLPFELLEAPNHRRQPVTISGAEAPCQQVVIGPPFDLRTLACTSTRASSEPRMRRPARATSPFIAFACRVRTC
jgi:4-hydroxy-3-polyprenylbenzoate decarboxylase